MDAIISLVPELRQHDFIAKEQAQFFENAKSLLKLGEVLVVLDFSENFSFIIQDAIQGVYWNNEQATIHPLACYWRNPATAKVEPLNLLIISDHLRHVTAAVSKFQEVFLNFLHDNIPALSKVIYFSDGCPGQYKNRFNMKNLVMHEEDYGVEAEWHFFATSHGKGPSDGLGGTLERMAIKASLQSPYYGQIKTPEELFLWADENIKCLNCAFVKSVDIKKKLSKKLAKRFQTAPTLTGIRTHHAFTLCSESRIPMKVLSLSASGKTITIREGVDSPIDGGADHDLELQLSAVASYQPRLHIPEQQEMDSQGTPKRKRKSTVQHPVSAKHRNRKAPTSTPTWKLSRLRQRPKTSK